MRRIQIFFSDDIRRVQSNEIFCCEHINYKCPKSMKKKRPEPVASRSGMHLSVKGSKQVSLTARWGDFKSSMAIIKNALRSTPPPQ